MKNLRKLVVALLVVAITFTTNLGGLEDVCKIHAGTTYYVTYTESINGVDWKVDCSYDVSTGPLKYWNITTTVINKNVLANKVIKVPEKVGNCPVTTISEGCFSGSDIKGIILGDNIKKIEDSAFQNCSKLKSVEYSGTTLPARCFSGCTSLEEVKLSGAGTVTLGDSAFCNNTSLKKLEIADTISSIVVEDMVFFGDSLLSDVSPLPNITLGNGSFAYCGSLNKIIFNGSVKYNRTDHRHSDYGAFLGAFEESDEEKEVMFNSDADIPNECFDSCTGLNKVTINGSATLGDYAFWDCKKLNVVQFGTGKITLGNKVFSKCDSLKELEFQADVDMISETDVLHAFPDELSTCELTGGYPFDGSSIEKIRFNSGIVKIRIDSSSVKELYFNADRLYGGIDICPNLETVVFENGKQLVSPRYDGGYCFNFMNKCKHKCTIAGYSSTDLDYRIVENWINALAQDVKEKITFKNIISGDALTVTYDGKIVSDNPTIEDFDKTKLKVSAGYYDFVDKTYNVIDINPSTDGTDVTGYVTILPKSLHNGSNMFTVSFSGWTKTPTVEVVKKAPESIKVDWKKDVTNELVSNQPITVADVISGASVTYNDGSIETVPASEITLDKTVTTLGDNIFTASYTYNGTTISESKTFNIKANYITGISAEFKNTEPKYVGDTISVNDIIINATYKNNEDTAVEKTFAPSSLENATLKAAGKNTITVKYDELTTTLDITALGVEPVQISANFDKTNTYIEGQSKFDVSAFAATVTYNNGTTKDNYNKKDITLNEGNCQVVEKTRTNTEVTVVLRYTEDGVTVTSQEIIVPITAEKITSIKATSKIVSMVEGATFNKKDIDTITITYNSGKIETEYVGSIKYDELTISHDPIVANKTNIITVNYFGAATTIEVQGVSKSVTKIEAKYTGKDVTVGDYFDAKDLVVTIYYTNGQSEQITQGFVIKDSDKQIVSVGDNIVYVYYDTIYTTVTIPGKAKSDIIPAVSTPTTTPTETPIIITPDSELPLSPVSASSISISSNVNTIKIASTMTYNIYTNKTVKITVAGTNISHLKYQVVKKGASLSSTGWKIVNKNTISISATKKASIVYIQYVDADASVQTIHTKGFLIDKKKATANVKAGKIYKKGQKITFKDAASGIKSAKLDGKTIKSGKKVTKKGAHTLVLIDKAGNKNTIKFKIK